MDVYCLNQISPLKLIAYSRPYSVKQYRRLGKGYGTREVRSGGETALIAVPMTLTLYI